MALTPAEKQKRYRERLKAKAKAARFPTNDVTEGSIYAFLNDGISLMDEGLEDSAGRMQSYTAVEVVEADGKNVRHIEIMVEGAAFRITVERIA